MSSLTLISCGVASSDGEDQLQANRRGDLLATIFRHDSRLLDRHQAVPETSDALMGADDAVVAGLTPEQRELVGRVIDQMNPVSPRAAGVAFDNHAAMPNERISAVRAPTLILHAKDDALQLFHNAEFAAATIPDARLVSFERGGHLVLAVEQTAIREAVQKHILEHAGEPNRTDLRPPGESPPRRVRVYPLGRGCRGREIGRQSRPRTREAL